MGQTATILKVLSLNTSHGSHSWALLVKFLSNVAKWMSQNTFDDKSTLVQVIANVDPDLCHHKVSLGHNELMCHIDWFPVNSLVPGRFLKKFRYVIFLPILVTDGWDISIEIVLLWMSLHLTDDKSTLVQVMAWCHQATSHYRSQCWPRSVPPYGVTRPQWVNSLSLTDELIHICTVMPMIMLWLTNEISNSIICHISRQQTRLSDFVKPHHRTYHR